MLSQGAWHKSNFVPLCPYFTCICLTKKDCIGSCFSWLESKLRSIIFHHLSIPAALLLCISHISLVSFPFNILLPVTSAAPWKKKCGDTSMHNTAESSKNIFKKQNGLNCITSTNHNVYYKMKVSQLMNDIWKNPRKTSTVHRWLSQCQHYSTRLKTYLFSVSAVTSHFSQCNHYHCLRPRTLTADWSQTTLSLG